jgi:hypothetical protein
MRLFILVVFAMELLGNPAIRDIPLHDGFKVSPNQLFENRFYLVQDDETLERTLVQFIRLGDVPDHVVVLCDPLTNCDDIPTDFSSIHIDERDRVEPSDLKRGNLYSAVNSRDRIIRIINLNIVTNCGQCICGLIKYLYHDIWAVYPRYPLNDVIFIPRVSLYHFRMYFPILGKTWYDCRSLEKMHLHIRLNRMVIFKDFPIDVKNYVLSFLLPKIE